MREPDIRSYPLADEAFYADVIETLRHARATIRSGRRLIDVVRADLLRRYPAVEIHERDELASIGETSERWYVYRDGRIA